MLELRIYDRQKNHKSRVVLDFEVFREIIIDHVTIFFGFARRNAAIIEAGKTLYDEIKLMLA
jgi:hypothetical protein